MNDRSANRSLPRRVLVVVGLAALAVVVLYLLLMVAQVLLVVFAGVLVAVFLSGVSWYLSERLPISRGVALALIVLVLVGGAVGLAVVAGPPLAGQVVELTERLPEAFGRLQAALRENPWRAALTQDLDLSEVLPAPSDVLGGVTAAFSTALGAVTYLLIVLVIGIYGAATPRAYVDSVLRLVPPARRRRARQVMHALGRALGWWLVGRAIMMAIVGVLTTAGLWVAGIPSPPALGLIAALLSFVPYVGPVLSAIPALMVAALIGLTQVLYVLGVYGAVQLLESYLITPLVQERTVFILPAALITAEVLMGVLAGALGVLMATPLAVAVIVLVQTLYVESVLGESVKILGEHGDDDR